MLVSIPISNLIQGVSQQPPQMRLPSQLQEQVNAYPSLVDGLTKRPPTNQVAKLADDANTQFIHFINRDSSERYVVRVTSSSLKVFTIDGVEKNVYTDLSGTTAFTPPAYLNTPGNLRAVTIADYTFLLNRGQSVAMAAGSSGAALKEALVTVVQASYSTDYKVTLKKTSGSDQVSCTFKAVGASSPTQPNSETIISTLVSEINKNQSASTLGSITGGSSYTNGTYLNVQLEKASGTNAATVYPRADITVSGGAVTSVTIVDRGSGFTGTSVTLTASAADIGGTGSGFTVPVSTLTNPEFSAVSYGSTLLVSHASIDFTVKIADSGGGSLISCAKGRVQRLADLPLQAKHGFKVAVGADVEDPLSGDYYVEFVANDGSSGSGYWKETVGFSVKTSLDAATMPYVLVRRSDSNFACYKPTWTGRTVGDATTAPDPSFVGRKIKDIFLFRNRLGVISDDKVVLSESGQYFNFFRTTVTQVIDSEPVDVSVGHSKIASLESAITWDERLILFSPLTQFSLGSGTGMVLGPNTVEVVQTTEFENASDVVRPEATGRSLLFVQKRGSFSGVREYIRVSSEEKYDGVDITANVPAYISGDPKQIAVSTHDSTGFIRTSTGFYNYKWFVNGNEKIQSAWSKWDLGTGVVVQGMEWYDQALYVVVTRSSKTYLEKIDFGARLSDSPLGWMVHLDRRVKVTATTSGAASGTTIIPLTGKGLDYSGISPTSASYPTVVIVTQLPNSGPWTVITPTIKSITSTQIVVDGSYNGLDAWVGVPYTMSFTMSRPYVKSGDVPVIDGRLQLTYGRISYEDTGHFVVGVTPKYRASYSYPFNGGILGAALVQGGTFLATDTFRFPIHCRSEDSSVTITNPSYLPSRFLSAAIEGNFTPRNRQI